MTPLEPLYTLRVAVEMIPMPSLNALEHWLARYAQHWTRRYQLRGRAKRRTRLLLHSEVQAIRAWHVKEILPADVRLPRIPATNVRRVARSQKKRA